jgi:RNA 2',3'-cyclic 3'-phosphodiesterase
MNDGAFSGNRGAASSRQRPIRTFIAVLISSDLKRKIASVQEEFKKVAPKVKWVAEANYHVTIKFLGDVEGDYLAEIVRELTEAVHNLSPFNAEIGGGGAFPSAGRPRTIWIGTTSGQKEFADIAQIVETSLERLGFPREDRPFRSHVTIGRAKEDRDAVGLVPVLREDKVGHLGTVRVESIAVMKSDLQREGPIYSILSEIRFRGGEETDVNG